MTITPRYPSLFILATAHAFAACPDRGTSESRAVDHLARELAGGTLTIQSIRFPAGTADAEADPRDLELLARAVARVPGVFEIVVPAEWRPGLGFDTVQARRRAERVRSLLARSGASMTRVVLRDATPLLTDPPLNVTTHATLRRLPAAAPDFRTETEP